MPSQVKAVLFDLDGVLTPTAGVHEAAWKKLFTDYFSAHDLPQYTDEDYFIYLDGRPRYDAVQALLASRGVILPYGSPDDSADEETVCGLGNRKNRTFGETIRSTGIEPYPGAVRYLDYLESLGDVSVAVVSSSKNAREVLEAAGLLDRFSVIVDGKVAAENDITGKPAPDTYLYAAALLQVNPQQTAIVEDAVSGVNAGRSGNFQVVVGVDRGAGRRNLLEGGATVVVDELDELIPSDDAEFTDWIFTENNASSTDPEVLSTLFALTNGHLGIRGDLGLITGWSSRGTYLNGFHEIWRISHAEDAHGFARIGQSIIDLPDATGIEVRINGAPVRQAAQSEGMILADEVALNLATGIQTRTVVWESPDGARVELKQKAAVSLVDSHLAVISLEVRSLDGTCEVGIRSQIMAPPRPQRAVASEDELHTMGDPRQATKLIEGSLSVKEQVNNDDRALLIYRSQTSQMEAALNCSNLAQIVDDEKSRTLPVEIAQTDPAESIAWEVSSWLEPHQTLRFTKAMTYARDDLFETSVEPPRTLAMRALHDFEEIGEDEFFVQQAAAVKELWQTADVAVELDPAFAGKGEPQQTRSDIQVAVRWSLFQLLQGSALITRNGFPAKSLTGSGYDGHYFWDTEIYVLPFLSYSNPASARELLHYRYLTLDAARLRAAEMTEKGALFPWRTIGGAESSAFFPAGTAQYHIDADIAYGIDQYVNSTGDYEFLATEGIDILIETARLWFSLGFHSSLDGEFHIHGVTGPDEYTAIVNDNFYTNVMARENLLNAVKWLRWLEGNRPEDYERVVEDLTIAEEELVQFETAAENMHIPWNEKLGIHPQDDSFLTKKPWDFEGTPPEKYPLLLNFHPLVIYRHQVLKQADTILALYLAGPRFTTDEKRADFDYYDPITTGDSSLSAVAQAIIAAEIGEESAALHYFTQAIGVDLDNLHSNTGVGVHVASLGGVWSTLVMGFAGLRDLGGKLRFNPRLPKEWGALRFTLVIKDHPLRIDITKRDISFLYEAGAAEFLEVDVAGKPVLLKGGDKVNVPLTNQTGR